MGTTSALQSPLAIRTDRLSVVRLIVAVAFIVAITAGAFFVGRLTVNGSSSTPSITPAVQHLGSVSVECRPHLPC